VWFLKEKGLINKDLFELEELKKLIVYEKNSSFYTLSLSYCCFSSSLALRSKYSNKPPFKNGVCSNNAMIFCSSLSIK
jgi:hypothetical protein